MSSNEVPDLGDLEDLSASQQSTLYDTQDMITVEGSTVSMAACTGDLEDLSASQQSTLYDTQDMITVEGSTVSMTATQTSGPSPKPSSQLTLLPPPTPTSGQTVAPATAPESSTIAGDPPPPPSVFAISPDHKVGCNEVTNPCDLEDLSASQQSLLYGDLDKVTVEGSTVSKTTTQTSPKPSSKPTILPPPAPTCAETVALASAPESSTIAGDPPPPPSVLTISPDHKVTFEILEGQLVSNLTLTNISSNTVGFKFCTAKTNKHTYMVRPAQGTLSPGVTTAVNLRMFCGPPSMDHFMLKTVYLLPGQLLMPALRSGVYAMVYRLDVCLSPSLLQAQELRGSLGGGGDHLSTADQAAPYEDHSSRAPPSPSPHVHDAAVTPVLPRLSQVLRDVTPSPPDKAATRLNKLCRRTKNSPPLPEGSAKLLPGKENVPAESMLDKLPNRQTSSVVLPVKRNRMFTNNFRLGQQLISKNPFSDDDDSPPPTPKRRREELRQDPTYIPGQSSPPAKPAFETPNLHPKKVYCPGSIPEEFFTVSPVSTSTPAYNPHRIAGSSPGTHSSPSPAKQPPKSPRSAPPALNLVRKIGPRAPPPRTGRNLEVKDRQGNTLDRSDPGYYPQLAKLGKLKPRSQTSRDQEWQRLKIFITQSAKQDYGQSAWDRIVAKPCQVPEPQLALIISDYLENRINNHKWNKDQTIETLDTNTWDKVWAMLASAVKEELGINVNANAHFNICRETKNTMKRDAQARGYGQLAHQKQPLSVEVLEVLFHSGVLNLYQPFPLIGGFFCLFALTFLPRVGEEMFHLKRKDLVLVKDENGKVVSMLYCPSSALKMNNGVAPSSEKASRLLKSAVAVPCPENTSVCLISYTLEIFKHLDMLPFTGDRGEQRIFYKLSQGRIPIGHCFFKDFPMGLDTFQHMFNDVMTISGIDLEGLRVSNQTLRVSAFTLHQQLGFTEEETASVAGHSCTATQRIYKRKHYEKNYLLGAAVQAAATGTAVALPTRQLVLMRDGSRVAPKPFLPSVDPKDSSSLVGAFPIGSRKQDLYLSVDNQGKVAISLPGQEASKLSLQY